MCLIRVRCVHLCAVLSFTAIPVGQFKMTDRKKGFRPLSKARLKCRELTDLHFFVKYKLFLIQIVRFASIVQCYRATTPHTGLFNGKLWLSYENQMLTLVLASVCCCCPSFALLLYYRLQTGGWCATRLNFPAERIAQFWYMRLFAFKVKIT